MSRMRPRDDRKNIGGGRVARPRRLRFSTTVQSGAVHGDDRRPRRRRCQQNGQRFVVFFFRTSAQEWHVASNRVTPRGFPAAALPTMRTSIVLGGSSPRTSRANTWPLCDRHDRPNSRRRNRRSRLFYLAIGAQRSSFVYVLRCSARHTALYTRVKFGAARRAVIMRQFIKLHSRQRIVRVV